MIERERQTQADRERKRKRLGVRQRDTEISKEGERDTGRETGGER